MALPLHRLPAVLASVVLVVVAGGVLSVAGSSTASASAPGAPVHVTGRPMFTTDGGAKPVPSDRTVPHWFGTFTDPTNDVTYGFNMVGNGDPRSYTGTTTVATEIIPLNLTFSTGQQLDGSDVTKAMAASPIWQDNSYATARVTPTGAAQPLSGAGTTQYEDAVMRSQFDDVGPSSTFHLLLGQPTVLPAQTLVVPANQGLLASFGPGFVPFGDVDEAWFAARMNNLINSLHLDPAILPIFVANNVYLYEDHDFTDCCVIGFHGAAHVTGNGLGSAHGSGSQGVQTFIYAAYAQPGTWTTSSTPASPDGADGYYIDDINALSHEIAEWADDPFDNNAVNPWLTPPPNNSGEDCSNDLETGDPVVGIGVLIGSNGFFQGGGANADGAWHPEDEVFLPWFARQLPNTTSEPLQNASTGRYTFFGDLNPYPGFQMPAVSC